MTEEEIVHVIPFDRLPPGFAARLDAPPEPARPRPAATIILLRPGPEGPEALLVRRARNAGFVPGAWVFPGGRVDPEDGAPDVVARLHGATPDAVSARLGFPPGTGQGAAYVVAAVREAFEETGILVGCAADGGPLPSNPGPGTGAATLAGLRRSLLDGRSAFAEVLAATDAWIQTASLEYISHWITPAAEPKRFDTRFFAAVVPGETGVEVDGTEVTDATWVTPAEALERHGAGELPMIFPTLRTLEGLVGFDTPRAILEHHRARRVPTILPRLVRTTEGVGLRIETR